MPQTQAYFQTLGAGSSIPSIRKSELGDFLIALPNFEIQERIVAFKQLHNKDVELSQQILAEKRKLFQALISNLITNKYE